ncbi:MAG: hypothetical protein RIQ54_450, partial [Candidatus Parcubacteria bacterium]
MIQTGLVTNFDLFAVGVAVTTTLLLGFLVFFRNPRGFTSRAFLFFTITSAIWSIFNYLNYQFSDYSLVLWTIRFVMFFAVWQSFAFFLLMWVIPYGKVLIPRGIFWGVLPLVVVTSFLTLTPFVFSGVYLQTLGQVAVPRPAPAIIVFAALNISLIIAGVYLLFKKIFRSIGSERKQLFLIALGMIAMFVLVIVFNFFLPVLFENTRFIPLSALFIFPFALFFYYAIARYHFLNVKVIATELAAFFLITATLSEILFSPVNSVLFVLRIGIFSFVLAFSILLIRSVLQEVRQREQLEELSQKLALANDELQSLNQFKTQLLSLASHQIKSPLAAIKGFASILLDGLYGPLDIKVRDVVEKIKYSTNDLVELINS